MAVYDIRLARYDETDKQVVLGGQDYPSCFLCGGRLNGVMVLWSGLSGGGDSNLIHFHPHCAQEMGGLLIKDGLHAEAVVLGKPVDGGVSIPHKVLKQSAG